MGNDYVILELRQRQILQLLGYSQSYFQRLAFGHSKFMERAKEGHVTVAKLADALEVTEQLCRELCEMNTRDDNIMIAKQSMKAFHQRKSSQKQPGEPAKQP